MREHLLYAIEHGADAPLDRNGWSMDACAANILALLYGKEEAGDDHSLAVPPSVIAMVMQARCSVPISYMCFFVKLLHVVLEGILGRIPPLLGLKLTDIGSNSMYLSRVSNSATSYHRHVS
jgi:hypothetical protein